MSSCWRYLAVAICWVQNPLNGRADEITNLSPPRRFLVLPYVLYHALLVHQSPYHLPLIENLVLNILISFPKTYYISKVAYFKKKYFCNLYINLSIILSPLIILIWEIKIFSSIYMFKLWNLITSHPYIVTKKKFLSVEIFESLKIYWKKIFKLNFELET